MLKCKAMRKTFVRATTIVALLLLQVTVWAATATGVVTLGGTDPAQPLAGVMVSDGVTSIVRTDTKGEYSLPLGENARFVMVINPPGCEPTRSFYQRLPEELPEEVEADFVLQPAGRPVDAPFTFAHITDSHGSSRLPTALRIIEPLNALTERPVFVMETGDISADDTGGDPVESYATLLEMPYFPVTGNHDSTRARGQSYAGWEFEQQFGPWYYAWYCGRYLFVGLPWSPAEGSLNEAAEWLERLLAMNAQTENAHVIVGIHHWDSIGRGTSQQLARFVQLFRDYRIRAMFMGHWHTAQVYQAWEIPVYMGWNVGMGNRDLAAGGFRLITAEPDGTLRSTFRSAGLNQHVRLSAPADGAVLARGPQPVVVNAFDTACNVRSVTVGFLSAASGELLQQVELTHAGGSCWTGQVTPGDDWPEDLRAVVGVIDERGEAWPIVQSRVTLGADQLPRITSGSGWPMTQRDTQRTGVSPDSITPPLSLAWAHATGSTFGFNSPIAVGDTVYTSVDNNDEPLRPTPVVLALEAATGARRWAYELAGKSVRGGLAGSAEAIYALADTGTLLALDPANGELLWERSELVADPVWKEMYNGAPALDGSTVVAGAGAALAAWDARDGSLRWKTSVVSEGGRRWTPNPAPALIDGRVLLAWDNLHSLSQETGEEQWVREHQYILTFSPTVSDGKVLMVVLRPDEDRFSHNRLLAAMDVTTGEQLWTVPMVTSQRGIYTSPVATDDRVYAFDDRNLYAIDLQSGKVLWQLELPQADVVTGSAALAGDHLYFVQSSGLISVVNVVTQQIVWSYDLGARVDSSPAVSGNALYVAARDGTLYAFVGAQ